MDFVLEFAGRISENPAWDGALVETPETRLTLEAAPEVLPPAKVSFAAARAQFTSKCLETQANAKSSCSVSG